MPVAVADQNQGPGALPQGCADAYSGQRTTSRRRSGRFEAKQQQRGLAMSRVEPPGK